MGQHKAEQCTACFCDWGIQKRWRGNPHFDAQSQKCDPLPPRFACSWITIPSDYLFQRWQEMNGKDGSTQTLYTLHTHCHTYTHQSNQHCSRNSPTLDPWNISGNDPPAIELSTQRLSCEKFSIPTPNSLILVHCWRNARALHIRVLHSRMVSGFMNIRIFGFFGALKFPNIRFSIYLKISEFWVLELSIIHRIE